eukprot:jgi/Ulvmu1/12391/UM009_0037.1
MQSSSAVKQCQACQLCCQLCPGGPVRPGLAGHKLTQVVGPVGDPCGRLQSRCSGRAGGRHGMHDVLSSGPCQCSSGLYCEMNDMRDSRLTRCDAVQPVGASGGEAMTRAVIDAAPVPAVLCCAVMCPHSSLWSCPACAEGHAFGIVSYNL